MLPVTVLISFTLLALSAALLAVSGRLLRLRLLQIVPALTGTPCSLGGVKLSLFKGNGLLKEVQLGNPPGYEGQTSLSAGRISFTVSLMSLFTGTITIRQVTVHSPSLVYEGKGLENNIETISRHISEVIAQRRQARQGKKKRRVIIEQFNLLDASVGMYVQLLAAENVLIPLGDIELTLPSEGGLAASLDAAFKYLEATVTRAVSEPEVFLEQAARLADNLVDNLFKPPGADSSG